MNYILLKKREQSLISSPWLALTVIALVLLIDFLTKFWVQSGLPNTHFVQPIYPYGGIGVFKNLWGIEFSITHTTNRGAAWGILADYHNYLLYFRLFLVVGLIVYSIFYNKHPTWRIPLGLIIAGALGNIFDFYLYDHVVDMFHFIFWGYPYPVFNVADTSIFIGILWLFIASGRKEKG